MLLSISVDLDEIRHYAAIHAVESDEAGGQVYERAVARLRDWARQRRIPLTWFVVGRDLERAANAQIAAQLAADGDELGCHSYSHFYDLTRRSFREMSNEVERGVQVIATATGARVTGFRAPGYVVTDSLLALLREQGFAYDSSVFPCPTYFALKAAALARLSAKGRASQAIQDVPDVLRAPTVPYRVGQPYWFRGTGIHEIPIQVTGRARLPFIGSALTLAGALGARLLAQGVAGQPFVNLELHGIDVLDQQDGLSQLSRHQRDLRVPWAKKLDAIDAAVSVLTQKGYACVRLDELASRAASA